MVCFTIDFLLEKWGQLSLLLSCCLDCFLTHEKINFCAADVLASSFSVLP